jgi:hypothetical protein
MKILMLDSSTYGEDVNVDKFYGLGEIKSYQTSTRQEALERTAEFNSIKIFCATIYQYDALMDNILNVISIYSGIISFNVATYYR